MHSKSNLAFCRLLELFGQLQSPGSSAPGRLYLPSGQTVVALTAPPGQKWFSLQNCGKKQGQWAVFKRYIWELAI